MISLDFRRIHVTILYGVSDMRSLKNTASNRDHTSDSTPIQNHILYPFHMYALCTYFKYTRMYIF